MPFHISSISRRGTFAARACGRSGFTLFELMLVLMIIALTAAIVAPRAMPLSGRRLDATMRQAFAMARHARGLAVTKGIQTRIDFDPSQRLIWLEVESDPYDAPGTFERLGDEWGLGIELPEGVDFGWSAADPVTFKPDGTASDALILLTDTTGSTRGLEIKGATGLSRILEEDEIAYRQSRASRK